jgi:hypothetical protein
MAGNKIRKTTQQYLDISEIKDDTVIMKDGTLRSVLLVSSINFALKSEDEQNAIVAAYVSFLNNFDFPLQIVIQSRELNIDNYLAELRKKQKEQSNELLKIQTAEYIQYIGELISMGKIMSKRFYIVVSFNPLSDKHKSFFLRLREVFKTVNYLKMDKDAFMKRKSLLTRRTENIISGLASIGLNSVELDTQSLIELYYNTYNPRTSSNEKLANIGDLRVAE